MRDDIPEDPPLTPEQENLVSKLSETDIKIIDAAIMENITEQWRKVARVIGTTMIDLEDKFYGIPDLFYGKRVRALRAKELFESQGDLKKMRYSEVRLPKNETSQKS
jgi:hypothetical protein